jgi:hypothetical protein
MAAIKSHSRPHNLKGTPSGDKCGTARTALWPAAHFLIDRRLIPVDLKLALLMPSRRPNPRSHDQQISILEQSQRNGVRRQDRSEIPEAQGSGSVSPIAVL